MIELILVSFIAGFIGAVIPVVGPVSSLILHRALGGRHTEGVAMSLGASVMEAFYCALGIGVIGILIQDSQKLQTVLRGISAFVFLFIGLYFLWTKRESNFRTIVQSTYEDLKGSFWTGFLLIAFNPSIILSWSAISALFVSFGLINFSSYASVLLFAGFAGFGILCGSVSLIFIIKHYKKIMTEEVVDKIFKIMGIVLIILAAYSTYLMF
jgi:threonine/homoserine/homoserine lactone efflux protein